MHGPALLLALWPAGPAVGNPTRTELPRLLTPSDRLALRALVVTRTVRVRRLVPPPSGMASPAPDAREGAGLCLGDGRVLTASALVADWPLGGRAGGPAADRIEVRFPGSSAVHGAAVGFTDPGLGVAVLDVPTPPGRSVCPKADDAPPGDGDVGLGMVLYGVVDGRPDLAETSIRGPGQGPLAWYLVGAGDGLPLGTPLFSSRGTFRTLVGAPDAGAAGWVGLLPARAIRTFWEDRFRWDP